MKATWLGSIFGVALFALLGSKIFALSPPTTLPQAYYFYGTFAFLAGFNERWAQVMFSHAEQTIDAGLDDTHGATTAATGQNGSAATTQPGAGQAA